MGGQYLGKMFGRRGGSPSTGGTPASFAPAPSPGLRAPSAPPSPQAGAASAMRPSPVDDVMEFEPEVVEARRPRPSPPPSTAGMAAAGMEGRRSTEGVVNSGGDQFDPRAVAQMLFGGPPQPAGGQLSAAQMGGARPITAEDLLLLEQFMPQGNVGF